MRRRSFLLAAAAAMVGRRRAAQGGGHDPLYAALIAERRRFGRMIHLYGDSIFRGWALGMFDAPASHPLHAFRSPASMANLLLEENGADERFAYGGNARGEPACAPRIRRRAAAGVIRPHDVVAFEDAGKHARDPGAYEREWRVVRAAAADRHHVTTVMMSMFDYHPDPQFQYDAPFGGVTMNEATRSAAAANIGSGPCRWLDMNGLMDRWRSVARAAGGVDVMHHDGIHPNVWGQMLLCGELLKVSGLRPRTVASVTAVARANAAALAYGSSTFTADRATSFTTWCLLR